MANTDVRHKIIHLKVELHKWREGRDGVVKELNDIADNLDEHFNRICKAKVGGSAAAIGGGVLAAVGFGLSFVTFGASLGLTVAGGVIAGAGGATVSGSAITDAVLSRKRRKSAEQILQNFNERIISLQKECVEIGSKLEKYGNIEEMFPRWIGFWAKLVYGAAKGAKEIGWDLISKTILNSLRIASVADDAALAGARAGLTAFKSIGTAAGRGFHIAGGVFGIIMLPLDIYTLVDSSIDIHKSNPHEVSKVIRKMALKVKEECPSKDEIDKMIEETLNHVP